MTIGRRIAELRKFLELTQTEIASIMETTQNSVSLMENGRTRPTSKHLENLTGKVHVNLKWLETGDGEMFSLEDIHERFLTQEQLDRIIDKTPAKGGGVPFYDTPIEGCTGKPDAEEPRYMVDYHPFNDCTFYRPVFGESMLPRFRKGDTIACRLLSDTDSVTYGEVYLCTIRRGNGYMEMLRTIRRTEDPDKVSLVPLNPDYDALVVPKSDIEAIYIVKGRIERFI